MALLHRMLSVYKYIFWTRVRLAAIQLRAASFNAGHSTRYCACLGSPDSGNCNDERRWARFSGSHSSSSSSVAIFRLWFRFYGIVPFPIMTSRAIQIRTPHHTHLLAEAKTTKTTTTPDDRVVLNTQTVIIIGYGMQLDLRNFNSLAVHHCSGSRRENVLRHPDFIATLFLQRRRRLRRLRRWRWSSSSSPLQLPLPR